ncbi:uncharacterized protein CANTADRAFT_90365 [Suhomyces tanzawaensis NRRL Y-17324]|uniref:Uncharacterized protein n=1 Tax=Suhomyces tanzawaensis NRRL Y-17324 TaxID=984487 RepID=A0A1E4SID7_9ASCO|nr:uncharacterized protein CANTADRAFT_90365 [Suhomyces tanzawaensis NRRL Y-17324]ODV79276.1 hypothetical protein CANTADRAFT_90365 [Suhomyces tanzawaensis NRRL Y-17324]
MTGNVVVSTIIYTTCILYDVLDDIAQFLRAGYSLRPHLSLLNSTNVAIGTGHVISLTITS